MTVFEGTYNSTGCKLVRSLYQIVARAPQAKAGFRLFKAKPSRFRKEDGRVFGASCSGTHRGKGEELATLISRPLYSIQVERLII